MECQVTLMGKVGLSVKKPGYSIPYNMCFLNMKMPICSALAVQIKHFRIL